MSSRIIRAESPTSGKVTRFDFGSTALESVMVQPQAPPLLDEPSHQQTGVPPALAAETATPDMTGQAALAEQQAELVLRQARLKAAELEKEGYERGFSEGEKAGREVGEKMVEAVLKQYAVTLDELKSLRSNVLASSEREVVKLSLEVAKKVVRREVSVDEELILALVKVTLARLADQSVMTVHVNPKDYQSIQHHRSAAGHKESLHEGIRLQEDPLITRGGCLVETESGIIDARVEEQFREIEKGFFE